jgi:hypothetical protein
MHSVGEHSADRLRSRGLVRLRVLGAEALGTATIEVTLDDLSWEKQGEAIEALRDVFMLFMDELALEVRFEKPDDDDRTVGPVKVKAELEFA